MALLAQEEGLKQHPLFVDYGQLAASREWSACRAVFRRLRLPAPARIDLPGYGRAIRSGITDRRKNVVREAFLPGRNALLLLTGAAYARQKRAQAVCVGLLNEANHLFPDQTARFLRNVEAMLVDAVAYPVSLKAPLAKLTKSAVVAMAAERSISGTYSCHRGGVGRCGKCISCAEYDGA